MKMSCARVEELAPGFVLGALELDEMAAVREHLDSCPRAHRELNELGEVMPALAIAPAPLEPPAWLRESVLAAAQADFEARGRILRPFAAPAVEPADEPEPEASSPVRVIPLARVRPSRRRVAAGWFARAAAAVTVVGLATYAFVVQSDLSKARSDQENAKTILNVIAQQGSRTVSLIDLEQTGAAGTVALLPSGHVYVWLNHLPQTRGDEVYAVWITADDGARVKAGLLYPDGGGTALLDVGDVPASASLMVIVTLEPNPTVTRPIGTAVLSGVLSR